MATTLFPVRKLEVGKNKEPHLVLLIPHSLPGLQQKGFATPSIELSLSNVFVPACRWMTL